MQSARQISVYSGSREGTVESVFLNNLDPILFDSTTDWLETFKRGFYKIN